MPTSAHLFLLVYFGSLMYSGTPGVDDKALEKRYDYTLHWGIWEKLMGFNYSLCSLAWVQSLRICTMLIQLLHHLVYYTLEYIL